MMIQRLTGELIVGIVLTFAPQQGLTEDVNDTFYEDSISILNNLEKISWSYLVVTSAYMLWRVQMIITEFMKVLGMLAEI